ncbi:MAG: flagellar biosynthesis protein FlhF [Planctomycetota bacterium]|nr:flagellar biosynthesis protein FlhF [Planctomycetota bacterium]
MRLRTYKAFTHDEAFAAAQADLGTDLVVVQSRRMRRPGLLGIWQRPIVELTVHLPETASATAKPNSNQAAIHRASAAYASTSGGVPSEESPPLDMDLERAKTRRLAQALMVKLEREQQTRTNTERNTRAVEGSAKLQESIDARVQRVPEKTPTVAAPPENVARRFVLSDQGGARRLEERQALLDDESASSVTPPPVIPEPLAVQAAVEEAVMQQREGYGEFSTVGAARPESLRALYRELLEQEVTEELVEQLICEISDELGPQGLRDPRRVLAVARRRIAALLPIDDRPLDIAEARRVGRPHVVALIGPTGVGKTTTIAKLAAACRFRDNLSVGLITTDSFRMAAVDQLRSYAEILSISLEVVIDSEDMSEALARLKHCDVILLDTAGRSRRDTDRLGDLGAFLQAAKPDETHLVLSTTTGERTMLRDADAFSALGADRVVLTKLDEAGGFGIVLNVIQKLGTRISFVTTGQEVPDDIEHGGADRIARLLLSGLPSFDHEAGDEDSECLQRGEFVQ